MKGKAIRYSKNHVHVYRFDGDSQEWIFVSCRMAGDMSRCTGETKPLPRGSKFDSDTTITEEELLLAM